MIHQAAILADAMGATNRPFRWKLKPREMRILIYSFVLLSIAAWRLIPGPWHPALSVGAPHHTIYPTSTWQQTEDATHPMELHCTAYPNCFQNLKDFQGGHAKLKQKLLKDRADFRRINPGLGWTEAFYREPYYRRCQLFELNGRSREDRTFMGLDRIAFRRPEGEKAKHPVRVFVVAGQSNAEGHNHIRHYHGGREAFPTTLREQPRILFWPGSDTPDANSNLWTTLRVGESGAFGPEISFAYDMEQAMPGATIAIVKYAAGGTGIARSEDYTDYIPAVADYDDRGRNWHPPTDGREAGKLYSALIANVRNATLSLERAGKTWELSGFVWMQGEHEGSISRKMAEDYERLLNDFIRSVRKDLRSPALPFAIGQVNSHTWTYGDIARKCQIEVCRKDKLSFLVETVDLPRVTGDAAHFTADGMLTLGSRFAGALTPAAAASPAAQKD